MKIETLAQDLQKITDPRRQWGHKRHKLEDILAISLCSIVCGGEDFTDMETFGREREHWLRGFLELPNGIPDSDTFRRVLERVNPQELSEILRDWLGVHRSKRDIVSIDGKTIRGSESNQHKAYHVVSAFVRENAITLGELKTEEKSNEITAVPELLEMLSLKDAIVTADAMSCQTKIAASITARGADYVLGLKGNQPALLEDARLFFEQCTEECSRNKTLEKGHGRIETREYFLSHEIDWLAQKEAWANLRAIGAVKSTIIKQGETHVETRYFITSLTNVDEFSGAVREHWGIENQLHWCLDVIFREDASRAKQDNSPLNLNVLRKAALPLLVAADFGRIGIRKKMFKAALSIDALQYVLSGQK